MIDDRFEPAYLTQKANLSRPSFPKAPNGRNSRSPSRQGPQSGFVRGGSLAVPALVPPPGIIDRRLKHMAFFRTTTVFDDTCPGIEVGEDAAVDSPGC